MSLFLQDADMTLYHGDVLDVLRQLPAESVHMACTSPPFYGLRDYGTGSWEGGQEGCDHIQGRLRGDAGRLSTDTRQGINPAPVDAPMFYGARCGKCGARRVDQQIGLEESPGLWVARLVEVFREVRRVLRSDGTLWVEIGDSYAAGKSGRGDAGREGVDGFNGGGAVAEFVEQRKPPPGYKPKDLVGAPWLLAFALRADGWYLRSEVIWSKPNPMPESVRDRPTKSHSYVFMFAKSPRYFWDAEAIREPYDPKWLEAWQKHPKNELQANPDSPYRDHSNGRTGGGRGYPPGGRNRRSVWEIPTQPYPEAHFATWPEKLVEPMILAGTSERGVCPECGAPWQRLTERVATGWQPTCKCELMPNRPAEVLGDPVPATVLDPFVGSGTTCFVARRLGRKSIGIDLNRSYLELAAKRTQQQSLEFS